MKSEFSINAAEIQCREAERSELERKVAEFNSRKEKEIKRVANSNNSAPVFMKLADVKARTSLSTSEIYRRIEAGTFPTQIKLGAKSVAWLEHEINEWMINIIRHSRPSK